MVQCSSEVTEYDPITSLAPTSEVRMKPSTQEPPGEIPHLNQRRPCLVRKGLACGKCAVLRDTRDSTRQAHCAHFTNGETEAQVFGLPVCVCTS